MKLTPEIIEEIGKKLQTGCPAKYAAMSEGISEVTYYKWKNDGDELLKRITNKDGEIIEKEFKKLTDTEKLKVQFTKSIATSVALGHAVLAAAVYSAIAEDWKAAIEILSRRFPKEWAKKDYLHVDQEVTEKPNKLRELEDKHFKDIPANKMKEVIAGMEQVIEGARNGKPKGGLKKQSRSTS